MAAKTLSEVNHQIAEWARRQTRGGVTGLLAKDARAAGAALGKIGPAFAAIDHALSLVAPEIEVFVRRDGEHVDAPVLRSELRALQDTIVRLLVRQVDLDRLLNPKRGRGRPARRDYPTILKAIDAYHLITRASDAAARRYAATRVLGVYWPVYKRGRIVERNRTLVLQPKQREHLASLLHVKASDLSTLQSDEAVSILAERFRTAANKRR
jgi:hypothetical protein